MNVLAIQYRPSGKKDADYWLTAQQVARGIHENGTRESDESLRKRGHAVLDFHAKHSPSVEWRLYP